MSLCADAWLTKIDAQKTRERGYRAATKSLWHAKMRARSHSQGVKYGCFVMSLGISCRRRNTVCVKNRRLWQSMSFWGPTARTCRKFPPKKVWTSRGFTDVFLWGEVGLDDYAGGWWRGKGARLTWTGTQKTTVCRAALAIMCNRNGWGMCVFPRPDETAWRVWLKRVSEREEPRLAMM